MDMEILLQWINFLILAGALFYWARTPLKLFLRQRHDEIRKEIQEVSTLLQKASRYFKEYEKKLAGVNLEIDALNKEMCQLGEIEKKHLVDAASRFAGQLKEELAKAGEMELRKAKQLLHLKTLDLAFQIAEKTVREKITIEDQGRLSKNYLDSLRGLSV